MLEQVENGVAPHRVEIVGHRDLAGHEAEPLKYAWVDKGGV